MNSMAYRQRNDIFSIQNSKKLGICGFMVVFLILPLGIQTALFVTNQSTSNEGQPQSQTTTTTISQTTVESVQQQQNAAIQNHPNIAKAENQPTELPKILYEPPTYEILSTGLIEIQIISDQSPIIDLSLIQLTQDNQESKILEKSFSDHIFIEANKGIYRIEVKTLTSQSTQFFSLNPGNKLNYEFTFSEVTLNPYDFKTGSWQDYVKLYDSSNNLIWGPELVTSKQEQSVFVNPGEYFLEGSSFRKSIDASKDVIVPVLLSDGLNTYGIKTNQVAQFGELLIHVVTVNDMPKQSIATKWYNASNYAQTGTGTSNSTGYTSFTLAPEVYDLATYMSGSPTLQILNSSITISPGVTTIVEISLSHIQVYTVGNQYVYLYIGATTYYQGYSGGQSVLNLWVPSGLNYTVFNYDSNIYYYNIIPGYRERITLGTKVPHQVTWTAHTNDGRILANQSTMVHLRGQDLDYDPITFYSSVNLGSLTTSTPKWYADNVWGVDLNYTSPTTNDFYQIDLGLEDSDGSFANFTDFLSNRQSSVTLRNAGNNFRGLNGYNTFIGKYTGTYVAGGYSGVDGNVTYNIYDGIYSISWQMDSIFYSRNIKIDANIGSFYYQFNYTEIVFNVTAEWGNKVVSMNIQAFNQTDTLSTSISSISTNSSGLYTMILAPYDNYAFKAVGNDNYWVYNVAGSGATEQQIDVKFGGLAIYTFNGATPLNNYLYVYNGTSGALLYQSYVGGDGIILYRLLPFGNYSVWDYTRDQWFYNIAVVANIGQVLGDFINSKPTITSINTVPGGVKLNPGQNVTIAVVASDPDPIDTLDYTWTANVGSIIGTGPSILYVAPGVSSQYKISVNVTDQFGGWVSTFIYVSNRVSTVNVNVTRGNGLPYNGYVTIYRNRDNAYVVGGYVGTDGLYTFTNIYDEEYTIKGDTNFGSLITYNFIPDQSSYNFDFQFADLVINATTMNGLGFASTFRLRNDTTQAILYTVVTLASGIYDSVVVAPGTYTLEASGANSIFQNGVTFAPHDRQFHEFQFAQIELNATTAYANPQNYYAYLKDPLGSIILQTYIGSDGLYQFNVAPGNYTTQVADSMSLYEYNIIVSAHEYYQSRLSFGMIVVYVNDGVNRQNYNVQALVPNSSTVLVTAGSGVNGIAQLSVAPGTYDIKVNGVLTYQDVTVAANERVERGIRLNFAPVISSVVASPARIGVSSSTTVTTTITDLDYDYPYMTLSATPNVGTITGLMAVHKFTSSNIFVITFTYNSPALLSLYQIDIAVSDGDNTTTYTLFASDQNNYVNLYSYRAGNTPQSTTVYFFDYQTGVQAAATTTDAVTGYVQQIIPDGRYNVRFSETNSIYFRDLFIYGGQILNLTANFGEMSIFSSGSGGVPLNSYVYVRNATDSTIVAQGYTGSDGLLSYILAPGGYNVEVQQGTSIFFSITIIGGQEAVVGTEVPQLDTQPPDVEYYQGEIGHNVIWNFTDNNPDKWVLYLDNVEYMSGNWNGSLLTFNLDGYGPGIYEFRLFVNDTYGYYNVDTMFLTVNGPIIGPIVSGIADFNTEVETSFQVLWNVSGTYESTYQILRDGTQVASGLWFNGTSITFNDGNLLPGLHDYKLIVYNDFGTNVTYSIFVAVPTPAAPTVSGPSDAMIYVGTHSNFVWSLDSIYSANYSLVLDGNIVVNADWTGSLPLNLEFDLTLGTHSFIMYVQNIYGTTASWSFTITVVAVPVPSVTSFPDSTITTAENITLSWTITGVNGSTYTLYRDGSQIKQGTWTDGTIVNYLQSGLSAGAFNYTIEITNQFDAVVRNTAIITVLELIPLQFATTPNDVVTMAGTGTQVLTWTLQGNDPDTYHITLDGVEVQTNSWTPGGNMFYDASGLLETPGTYTIVFTASNTRGDTISDTVTITVLAHTSNKSGSPGITFFIVLTAMAVATTVMRKRRIMK